MVGWILVLKTIQWMVKRIQTKQGDGLALLIAANVVFQHEGLGNPFRFSLLQMYCETVVGFL